MPGSRTYTQPAGITVTVKAKARKAACPENQPALERMQEKLIKAQSNPNSNFIFTVRRAIVSLQECRHPITTHKQACELKYVGPSLAKVIVPNSAAISTAVTGRKTKETNGSTVNKQRVVVAPVARVSSSMNQNLEDVAAAPSIVSKSSDDQEDRTKFSQPALSAKEKEYHKAKQEAETLVLPPKGPWKVILVIDARERQSKQVVSHCKQSGIPCEERHLPIGDMAWVAQCVIPKTNGNMSSDSNKFVEVMVGTIIERKAVNDLSQSLYGTRYSEQRLRLSHCGLPQVLFLVEGDITQVANCSAETLQMAMMETRVQLGFQVIQTKNLNETVRVLKGLHRRIVQRTFPEAFDKNNGIAVPTFIADPNEAGPGENINGTTGRRRNRRPSSLLEMVFDTAPVPSFGADRFITYPELKAKVEFDREQGTKSVQAITMAMLKQIPSLSLKKCTAIAQAYPTMNRLLEGLCFYQGDPERLVSSISMGRMTVGPKSASEVVAACCTLSDGSVVSSHVLPCDEPTKKKLKRLRTDQSKPPPRAPPTRSSSVLSISCQKIAMDGASRRTKSLDSFFSSDDDSFSVAPVGSFASRKRPLDKEKGGISTPSTSAKIISKELLSDSSGCSLGIVSGALPTTLPQVKRRFCGTSVAAVSSDLNDSLLFSSPDNSFPLNPRIPSNPVPGRSAKTCCPVIDILDSDSDEDNRAFNTSANTGPKKATESACQSIILDTPSTASSVSTPGIPTGKSFATRKVSNDSPSQNCKAPNRTDHDVVSSLQDRLARRMDREVIEIDL